MRHENVTKGFTLIELLVVIAILGLIASAILVSVESARVKARDARRIQDIKQVQIAIELYYHSNNFYPSLGNDDTGYDLAGLATPLAPFAPKIPTEPLGSSWHIYSYVRGPIANNSYGILIKLEKQPGYCKTGNNVNMNWWGAVIPMCQ